MGVGESGAEQQLTREELAGERSREKRWGEGPGQVCSGRPHRLPVLPQPDAMVWIICKEGVSCHSRKSLPGKKQVLLKYQLLMLLISLFPPSFLRFRLDFLASLGKWGRETENRAGERPQWPPFTSLHPWKAPASPQQERGQARSTTEAGRPGLNRIKRPPGATALFFLQKNRLHYRGPPTGGVRRADLPGAAEAGDVASQPQVREPAPRDPEARQRT